MSRPLQLLALALSTLVAGGSCGGTTSAGSDAARADRAAIAFRDVGGDVGRRSDGPGPPSDRVSQDARPLDGLAPVDASSDGVPPRDFFAWPKDMAPPRDAPAAPGCASWPSWQCTAGAFFPCSASCTDTSSRTITCNSARQCSCVKNGQASSCATVAPATGCGLCQSALLTGCCSGD